MKIPFRSLTLALFATFATTGLAAVEPIESAEAQRIAHKLHGAIGSPTDAPFATDVDPDKAQGIKAKGIGLVTLPDRKLTADTFASAGKDVTPIGQLWALGVVVASSSRPLASEQLRHVSISEDGKSIEVQLYYLGAAKNAAGELELVVFAKEKGQPVLRVPVTKTSGGSQSAPIELDARKQDENTGILTLRLLGEYSAEIAMMKPE